MKSLITKIVVAFAAVTLSLVSVFAQDNAAAATSISEAATATSEDAAGLDLYAVAELFKNSENLEKFEQTLNDPQTGINNLDLDKNGEVDFTRVTEQVKDNTHLIVLQTPLGENDFQDVATLLSPFGIRKGRRTERRRSKPPHTRAIIKTPCRSQP